MALLSCLVPLGCLGQVDNDLEYKNMIREGGRGLGFGLLGLYMKGALGGGSFTNSRNWLTLGGIVSQRSSRPQMTKH